MKRFYLISLFLISLSLPTLAQNFEVPEFDTDRPSRSDASSTVPQGYFQFETGFSFDQKKTAENIENELKLPEIVARIGLTKRLEVRLRAQEHIAATSSKHPETDEGSNTKAGIDDIEIGGKLKLWEGDKWLPEAAFQAEVKLPIGSSDFETGSPEPKLRMAFTNKLTQKLALQYNLGLEWETNPDKEINRKYNHNPNYALNLSYDFMDKLEVFAELYGEKTQGEKFWHGSDAGVTYKFIPNAEVDVSGGIGLTENAPDFFVEAGFSFRLPN